MLEWMEDPKRKEALLGRSRLAARARLRRSATRSPGCFPTRLIRDRSGVSGRRRLDRAMTVRARGDNHLFDYPSVS